MNTTEISAGRCRGLFFYGLTILFLATLTGCGEVIFPPPTDRDNFILTVDRVGDGTVLIDPARTFYLDGSRVLLTAVAEPGWRFDRWERDATGTSESISVTMNRDRTIRAVFVRFDPSLVQLDVVILGRGLVLVDPEGIPRGQGFLLEQGTTVFLDAFPETGWSFDGFFTDTGELLTRQNFLEIRLFDNFAVVARFVQLAPPTPVFFGYEIFAADGQFLGVINSDPFDPNSLANDFGPYGDDFSPLSIWNPFSLYGSEFSDLSAYDRLATRPPAVFDEIGFIAYITKNTSITPRIDPDEVAAAIGRFDVIRN